MAASARVTLLAKEVCEGETGTFRFSRPDAYSFQAGQHYILGLDTADGEQRKAFSHAEAPSDPETTVTTRLSGSAFKSALAALEPGDTVDFSGPFGRMLLDDGVRRVVYLSGGVGITPVRSLLRDAAARDLPRESVLFFGNREDRCVPYRDELRALAEEDARVRLVECFEHPPAGWGGAVGFITSALVREHLRPDDGWDFVVSGPPAMVDAMARLLDELGVPEDLRHEERFTGY